MHPFRFEFDGNVYCAQAYGCWLYVQLGSLALFCGTHMPCGVRLVWRSWVPQIRLICHRQPKNC